MRSVLLFLVLFVSTQHHSCKADGEHDHANNSLSHEQQKSRLFLRVEIAMDPFPEEVGWKLQVLDENDVVQDTVASANAGKYRGVRAVQEEIDLHDPPQDNETWPVVYRFTITDTYGDGLLNERYFRDYTSERAHYTLSVWQRRADGSATRTPLDIPFFWQRQGGIFWFKDDEDDVEGHLYFHDYNASTKVIIRESGVERMFLPHLFLEPAPSSAKKRDVPLSFPTWSPIARPATTSPTIAPSSMFSTTATPSLVPTVFNPLNNCPPSTGVFPRPDDSPYFRVRATPNVLPFRKFLVKVSSICNFGRSLLNLEYLSPTDPSSVSAKMYLEWDASTYYLQILQEPEAFGMRFGEALLEISHYEIYFTNPAGEETLITRGTELTNDDALIIGIDDDRETAYQISQEPSLAPSMAPPDETFFFPTSSTTSSSATAPHEQWFFHFVVALAIVSSLSLIPW